MSLKARLAESAMTIPMGPSLALSPPALSITRPSRTRDTGGPARNARTVPRPALGTIQQRPNNYGILLKLRAGTTASAASKWGSPLHRNINERLT